MKTGISWFHVDTSYKLLAVNHGFLIRLVVVGIEVSLHRIFDSVYQVLILLLQQENSQFQRLFHSHASVADSPDALLEEPGRVRVVQIDAVVVVEPEDDAAQ